MTAPVGPVISGSHTVTITKPAAAVSVAVKTSVVSRTDLLPVVRRSV